MARIKFPDGSCKEMADGTTPRDILALLGSRLAKKAIVAKANGQLVDLQHPLQGEVELEILTSEAPESLEVLRHSTSHVMASAIKHLFPEAKFGIGPAIEDGFYYDIEVNAPFTPQDLKKIENEIKKIIKQAQPFQRQEVSREQALEQMQAAGEKYKVEILEELDPAIKTVSFYTHGDFTDLCRGPHLEHTGKIGAFKLLSTASAYWRGDANRESLQRIYGTAFFKKQELEDYLAKLEEIKKRDHRKLGKTLDLFSFHDEAPASPFFHPKGTIIYNLLCDYWMQEHTARGYQLVRAPFVLNNKLWQQSGHWEHYQENMFFLGDEKIRFEGTHPAPRSAEEERKNPAYAIKPMNCPGHTLIYRTQKRSYRDLPLRMAELGMVHRREKSGVRHGLMRVQNFIVDDAHIFCTPDQIKSEIRDVIQFTLDTYRTYGFHKYQIELSTRPEKSIGSDEIWEKSTAALQESLDELKIHYTINEGEGAFYGPKIDFHINDAIGRSWQCGTCQLDFSMPQRFALTYVGADGKEHTAVMIHRAIYGSLERFMGVLIEHYAGAFPLWLAPVQVMVIPITNNQSAYAEKVAATLREHQFRVETDQRSEKVGYKIREATLAKIPYMLVLGEREVKKREVAVRHRTEGDLGPSTLQTFITTLEKERAEKKF